MAAENRRLINGEARRIDGRINSFFDRFDERVTEEVDERVRLVEER